MQQLPTTVSNTLEAIFLVVALVVLLPILMMKTVHISSTSFAICRVLNLRRLAILILLAYIAKVTYVLSHCNPALSIISPLLSFVCVVCAMWLHPGGLLLLLPPRSCAIATLSLSIPSHSTPHQPSDLGIIPCHPNGRYLVLSLSPLSLPARVPVLTLC